MDWDTAFGRIQQMQGFQLSSISGKSDIELISVNPEDYIVRRQDGELVPRKTAELEQIVAALELNVPLHVDSDVKRGGGSSRSHPETVLANLPNIEWQKIGVKRIVWVGEDTHELGTLRQQL